MSETSSSISSTNKTQSTNDTSQSSNSSIVDQFLNEETDNMPNSITTNTSTNRNSITTNTSTNSNIQTENKTEKKIGQKTFDYNSENGLRDFINFLGTTSETMKDIPIDSQITDKAKIFDQIANYCSTQPILSKDLGKKYARMKKEIYEIKRLEDEKNNKIKKLKNEYKKEIKKWVKKNRDRESLSQEDKAFNPELQKFKDNYLKQKQDIEEEYKKKVDLRKAQYLHAHKFENWKKYINRNENYCMVKLGKRWKNKMLNKDSKITQNGAKYSDILEYLKNILEREKNKNKDKDKEDIIDKLISKVKEWFGLAQKEQTDKKEVDIITALENIVDVYNILVKEPEKNKLDLDTISKDVLQQQKNQETFNKVKQSINSIQQSSNKETVNIKDNNTSKTEDNMSMTAQSSKIDTNKVQQKNRDNNTYKTEDNISMTAQSSEIDANEQAPNEKEKVNVHINENKLLDEKKKSQSKDNLDNLDELYTLKTSLKQSLNNQKENDNKEKEVDMETLLNNQQTEFLDDKDDIKTVIEEFDYMKDYNMLDEIKEDIERDKKFITKTNKNDGIIIKNSNEKDKAQDKARKLHINIINTSKNQSNNPNPNVSVISDSKTEPNISIS